MPVFNWSLFVRGRGEGEREREGGCSNGPHVASQRDLLRPTCLSCVAEVEIAIKGDYNICHETPSLSVCLSLCLDMTFSYHVPATHNVCVCVCVCQI